MCTLSCVHNCDDQSYLPIILPGSNIRNFIYSLIIVTLLPWVYVILPRSILLQRLKIIYLIIIEYSSSQSSNAVNIHVHV